MNRRLSLFALLASLAAGSIAGAYPEPSRVPTSWELSFKSDAPRRIVVESAAGGTPKAYWYVTYSITNNTDQDRTFLPTFEWVTKDGKVIRSDRNISPKVFDRIKEKVGNKLLENSFKIAGVLRQGEDQAKDGVAIWEEPEARLGDFTIYVTGLSGETAALTDTAGKPLNDAAGKPLLLFKTYQLDYRSAGDDVYPGNDLLIERGKKWVMR